MIASGPFHRRAARIAAAALALTAAVASGQTPGSAAITGDAARGKSVYEQTYRCYACHGHNGETTALGVPRLVPMARSQDAFIAYLRKPSTPGMPSYPNVPAQDLADIHAYLRSRQSASPSAESVPLLKALLDRLKRQ
jgi:mono/diheme cytochrome c family protein